MKNPGLAAVLSFLICGLGQVYNGQILKGIIFFVSFWVAWSLTILLIGWLILPVVWIWGIYDAYRKANRINKGGRVEYVKEG